MPQGDRTLIEVQSGAGGGEDEDQSAKFKSGTLYMMLKELSRNSASPFQISGFVIESSAPGEGSHGYKVSPDVKKWMFYCKDRAITTWVAGNIMRGPYTATKTTFLSCAGWLWRFSVDTIHAKLTARKPFGILLKKLGVD